MSDLPFTPLKIKKLELKNRFVMSAAVDGLSRDADARARRYAALATGGVGLIIAGRVLDEREDFGRIADAVHRAGGTLALQLLSHMGLGFDPAADAAAASVVSERSEIFSSFFPFGRHHEATDAEIAGMIEEFGLAARLAKHFGVNAVQVHSAHSSALMQFLTPLINQRNDQWGGPIEQRVRIHKKVYDAIRAEVGKEMPILIKLGVEDPFPDGLKLDEGKIAAKLLAEHGYDAIEVSQGLQDFRDPKTFFGTPIRRGAIKPSQEGYFRYWCREVKKVISKPAIMTGGIRSYEVVEEILRKGEADLIGMCRPFIREPGLVKRWEGGDRRKATCISCNKCGIGVTRNLPLACYVKEGWEAF